MNWTAYITDLEAWGLSLRAISRAVESPVSTLCDIKKGRTTEPRANLAMRLIKLHAKYERKAKR